MTMPLTRRDFLHVAGAGALVSLRAGAAPPPAGHERVQPAAADGWFDRPMRWVQLTLVENDPGRFEPEFWLDYFRRLHADAATLSAGGIVAYYPTDIPLHHRSAWLGDGDPFGTLVAGCRRLDMHVVARTDPHAVRDEVRSAHPDWISTSRAGEPRRHWANPELWVTCALGPYNFDFMDRVHQEIVTRYKVDGVFANRWAPQGGDCYCVHCQRNFRDATGRELPRTTDARDPARRQYLEWRAARLTELWKHWDATVQAANPEARFIPNGPPTMKTAGTLIQPPVSIAVCRSTLGFAPNATWACAISASAFLIAFGKWKPMPSSNPAKWFDQPTATALAPTAYSRMSAQPTIQASSSPVTA